MGNDHWVLPLKDGTEIQIPPAKVASINKKIEAKEPIKTGTRTILWHELAGGPRLYQPETPDIGLAERVAQVFQEPDVSADGEIRCCWVKEPVSTERWNKYYSQFSTYQKLGNYYDKVMVAYRLPIHMLHGGVDRCTPLESQECDRRATMG